jgi:predicted GNAT family N-acyltransferase
MVAQAKMKLIVRNVAVTNEAGKDLLSLGFEIVDPTTRDRSTIGQYLVQFGNSASPDDLRAQDLPPESVARAIDFSFVRTRDELAEVLRLRTEAYSDAGKVGDDVDLLADSFDAKSRIVIGKHNGRIVASARVFIPQSGDLLEHEDFLQLPEECARREDLVEIMRVCTDNEYRRSDLLLALFRYVAITCVQASRFTVVGCATPELVPIYRRIGFRATGIRYTHPLLNNKEHVLLLANAKKAILGIDINPIIWNLVWRDTAKYLVENEFLTQDPLSQSRLFVYRLLGPVANLISRRARKSNTKKTK